MMLADDERNYLEVNAAACELIGMSREEILELKVEDLTAPELRERAPEMFAAFLEEGTQAGPFKLVRTDGEEVEILYSATANILPGVHLTVMMTPEHEEPETDLTHSEGDHGTPELTAREREVLTMLALGENNQTIAKELHLSPETVRNYTRSARAKLGARSRSHAIAIAVMHDQLDLGLIAAVAVFLPWLI